MNEVYKLTIIGNPNIIQGVLSIRKETDHIFMNLLENAPFNIGRQKLYEGVAGNLVAFACKLSFQYGFEGFVSFTAKTKLIQHYIDRLGAHHFGGQKMIIETHASKILVEKYFKTSKIMGFIKEPKGVDFIIQSKPLTNKEREEISKYIADYKAKNKKKKLSKTKRKQIA